ncbi:MAG: class I SAM-dependent methyltransferase [Planctomycetes bacterium]|nr:class I SAM-dependent methyltransferase [Planctomycetota bacterium]
MSGGRCALCGGASLRRARAGLEICPDCGLGAVYPLADPGELRALYTRDYYEAWGPDGGEDPAVREMKQATFRARLRRLGPLPAGARVLDVGCATGHFLDLVAAAGGEPHGVEVSPYAAEVASGRHPGRVRCGTLEEAGYPADHFHAVFLSDVIEHVPQPAALLAEVWRIVAPGGRVVVATPDLGSAGARLLGRRWFHRKGEHIVYFSRRSLRWALGHAGFGGIRLRRGSKTVTLAYLASHFRTYPLFPVTPVLRLLDRCLPCRLLRRRFRLPTGEIVAHAHKPHSGAIPG